MAELKHTFTSGRMNKDLDERLIPNGEYIDAQNIQISSSEGSDVGAIENLLGNEKLSSYGLKNKIYWIVTSDKIDGIYEFDEKQQTVSPILIDSKETKALTLNGAIVYSNIDNELIIDNFNSGSFKELIGNDLPQVIDEEKLVKNNISIISYDPYIKISIPKNTVIKKNSNGKLEFKNIEYNGKKYGGINLKATYTSNGILNFSKNNLITGINIVDDLLFWTDNLNQPRRINISSFKKYTDGIKDQDTQIEYAEKNPVTKQITKLKRNFTEDDISVIKKSPMYAPSMELYDSVTDGKVDIKYTLNLTNVFVGQVFTLNNLTDIPSWAVGDFVTITAEGADFSIDASVKSNENSIVEISIATLSGDLDNQSYDCDIKLKQKKALYELNFVRFAYRWKYKNGEYSTLSPFTEAAFYPDEFKYDGKEAFNYGMINKLQRVVLNNFDLGNDDISEIDILFKEGRNQNIYVLKTVKKLDFTNEYIITKEQIHSVIPNDQLLRAWDNVPKRAKAQEITANRVIYGNYTQNYDVYNEPDIAVSTVPRVDELNRTIKSNRTYQIGVVYIDEYNRHTPVLSNDSGAFNISKDNSILKNQFSLSLKNQPPAWAKYFKYYIKDTSGEYYNLSADRFYQDVENGFTYISFPSSDRNKVTNDHYLILKKKHGANEAVLDKDNRYKIIDIFSDPPEFITNRKRTILSLADIVFTDDYSGAGGGTTVTNKTDAAENAPLQDYATIQIKQANSSADGVALDDAKEIKPGRYISFEYLGKESKAYKIKRLSQHPSGDNEIKIDFEDPFGDDVEIIYNKTSGNIGDASTNFGVNMNILEEYSAAGDKEFDGRFFIKLKSNSVLESSVVSETIGGVSYLAKKSIPLIGVYSKNDDNGTGRRGENTWFNINRIKDNASKDPKNEFVVSDGGTAIPGNTPETGKRVVKGALEYNITLESATENMHKSIDALAKTAKIGNFVRFVNPDGTPHHDTVYEIGSISTDTYETKYGATGLWSAKGEIKRIHFRFIDENGEFKPLDANVVKRGDDTWGKEPTMEILQELTEENVLIKDPAIFETEPLERKTELDIYYETEKAIPVEEHGQTHTLNWYNAISFGNGVESNRIRDDFNAIFIDTGVRASTVLAEPFKEEHKFNGLIWSGIINSRSGTNQSNQFNMANTITKDLLPSYGSVQKLFARDGDIVIYCEDKIVRALADKDILYNADGSANVTASNRVIGNVIPFTGEYGISQNPESFAFYGFRAYHADPKRGVVLRLSQDGLTPISAANMSSYFRGALFGIESEIIGSYDNRNKLFNLSIAGSTVCFSEDVNGWVTFKSFLPQNGISLNNVYYTYNNGELWQHDSPAALKNNFYGEQYQSSIELNINDNPSVVKKYKTLGYEGTAGWIAQVETDQQTSSELFFKEKENKYFVNITGEAKELLTLDAKNFSAQGIGRSVKKTSISYSSGNVVVGQNGEIIILGGGDGIIGPDYIITGDKIDYDIKDNGDIVVTGNNVGGGSGTGDTGNTGGDVIGSGGGTIDVNDTGGGGSDGSGGSGTGDFGNGGSGVGIDSEDDYNDQLGNTSNTTATFGLLHSGNFESKQKTITQKPGELISQIVFTITPAQGYQILASNFTSAENITFIQDGSNIKATLNISLSQPNNDESYFYNISGKSEKLPIEINGTISLDLTNASINNSDIKTYSLKGEFGEEKTITERIITASNGYYLTADSISVDNNNIFIEKIKLSDNSYKIVETVFIPKNKTTDSNYTITVNALKIFIPDPKIISKTISTGIVSNSAELRTLTVNGQENAEFEVIFSDTSNTILKQSYKIDFTGKKEVPLVFDGGDTAETYTIKINNLTGTDIHSGFGSQSITLNRNARGRVSSSLLVKYSSSINNNFTIEDYIGESTNRQFSFDLTLPAGTYTIGKQPTSNDINFGDNENGAFIILKDISFDAVNTNVLTVSGTLFVTDFQVNETYNLNISSFVGKNVTTTFDYSENNSGGTASGDYSVAATSYTVSGGGGLLSTPTDSEYFFTLTPDANFVFKNDIDADDFELLDASNNNVASDYALGGEILLRKIGNQIEIGFKSKTFTQPSASSTFTLRPKPSVTLTQAEVVTEVPKYSLKVNIKYTVDGVLLNENTITRSVSNFDSTGQTLFPIYHYLNNGGYNNYGAIDTTQFSNNTLFYINNTNNTEVTLAPAGSYTNDNGDAVTTAAEYEFNATTNILIANLLVNLNSDASISLNEVDMYINLNSNKVIDANGNISQKYYLVEIKTAGCDEQVGGPNENKRQWSPLVESDDRYPKWYSNNPTLQEGGRLYARRNSSEAIPGILANGFNIIQKGNPELFESQYRNVLPPLDGNGWLKSKGVCSLDGSHLDLFTNTSKHVLYNDIVKYKYPIKSDIYKSESQTLTGSIKISNKAAYDALIQDIADKGLNIKPIQGVDVNDNTLTFSYDAYFDSSGNSSFDFELLRGANEYGVEFIFDDLNSDSSLNKLIGTSFDMRRRATEDQDNNDHIPQATLNNYNVIEDYNTTSELSRYDDGSGNYDGTSNRATDNAPTGGGDYGFTGDVSKINIIPQPVLDNGSLLQYLNGTKFSSIMTSSFNWLVSSSTKVPSGLRNGSPYNNRVKNTSAGPLGKTVYIKTGYTVILPSPATASADYASFIGLWVAINNGDITSLKIPIDLISPSGSNKLKNEEIVTTERVSVDLGGGTIIDTTLDLGGGYAAVEETGWWNYDSIDTDRRLDRWKNYYIGGGNNIYISETTGPNGLKALPNFSGIEFTFGITAKYKTDSNDYMLAFANIPFYMDGFTIIPNSYTINNNTNYAFKLIDYVIGNSWDYLYHESYKVLFGATKDLMTNPAAHGSFNYQGNYLKFRMIQ